MNTIHNKAFLFLASALAVWGLLVGNVLAAGTSYSYDPLNRLTQVTYANGSTSSYTYDAAGNRLTYSGISTNGGDTVSPVISILSPTNGATYATASSFVTLSGIASDNFGISKVTWMNDNVLNDNLQIGIALGTTNWYIPSLPLLSGANQFTITAHDEANNFTDVHLTVIYTPPSVPNITGLRVISSSSVLLSGVGPIAGLAYIQTSTDLIHWQTISVLTNAAGTFQFPYPFSTSESKRFFRALPPSAVPASPQLTGLVPSPGPLRFSVNGLWGDNYVVQATTNFINWLPISTNLIPPSGFVVITDPNATNFSRRFYRAVPTLPGSP